MKKMKLKNKKLKKYKIKITIYLLIIYVSFSYTFYTFMKNNKKINNEEFINMLVNSGNANIINKYKMPTIINKTMIYLLKIDIKKPETILNNTILKSNNKKEKITLEYNDDYSNMNELKEVSDYIEDPNPTSIEKPLIYIYNSHQLENYSNENLEMYNITPNVLMASYLLREKLKNMGIDSIVEESNITQILDSNNWDYSYSYQASRTLLKEKMDKYKTLKYFIDIHRDSTPRTLSTTTINGKNYAKILFVIGKDYNSWQDNYNLANKINNYIDEKYKGLSKGIITKTGLNVNGVYNQDLNPNVLLIEVGGVENTIDEVNNTIDVIAETLYNYIKGE